MSLEFFVFVSMAAILLLWVLMPLVPAILIYRLFPNTSVAVSGPLAGLTVRAGGAFAAYLIVLTVIWNWTSNAYELVGSSLHPAWTIRGKLHVVSKDGTPIEPPPGEFFQKICLHTDPNVNTFQYPTFTITVPETASGIPKVYLETAYGLTALLDVDEPEAGSAAIKLDRFHKSLNLVKAIDIRQPSTNDSVANQPVTVRSQN